jgi:2-keto-3-deoxy-L-rhamnonate aldolase RhmA
MKTNGIEEFLAKIGGGRIPLGAAITFADPAVSEVACASGLDFLWFDGEHGEFDRETAMLHLMSVKGTGVASLYRVPSCDHTEIKRVIDFAPAGIIIPMVLTAEDAARAVDACRYPIHGGSRGFGPRRGLDYGAGDAKAYFEASAHEPLVMIQLEHIEAARNLDAILDVPGVDAVIVGPFDFTMSMKKPGQFHDPEVAAMFDECCRKVRDRGILLGCYTECDFDIWKRRGVQFMAIKNDTNAMMLGFKTMMKRVAGE